MAHETKTRVENLAAGNVQLDLKLPTVEKDAAARKRYGWRDCIPVIDERGRVLKSSLSLDGRYQRDATSPAKILRMAREWDERKAGRLLVARRPDGSLWVVDGGHRLRAAMLRDDVTVLDCDIFKSPGVEGEAELFLRMALDVNPLDAFARYHAGVSAGEETCVKVSKILVSRGWTAIKSGNRKHNILAIGTLVAMVKTSAALAERVLDLCIEAQRDASAIPKDVLLGVFVLARRLQARKPPVDILEGRDRAKLIKAGVAGLLSATHDQAIAEHKGGSFVFARGILHRVINKSRRTKIAWAEEAPE